MQASACIYGHDAGLAGFASAVPRRGGGGGGDAGWCFGHGRSMPNDAPNAVSTHYATDNVNRTICPSSELSGPGAGLGGILLPGMGALGTRGQGDCCSIFNDAAITSPSWHAADHVMSCISQA